MAVYVFHNKAETDSAERHERMIIARHEQLLMEQCVCLGVEYVFHILFCMLVYRTKMRTLPATKNVFFADRLFAWRMVADMV
jgi:hypothetical protein